MATFQTLQCALLFVLASTFLVSANEDIVVRTRSGLVKGSVGKMQNLDVFTFRNIPFAKPPTGELRFKAPEDVVPWNDVLDDTTGENITCPQIPDYPGPFGSTLFVGQENCLVLDIYSRQLPSKATGVGTLRPVLVYFHGGLFSYGSKNEYGPAFLLKENEIVLVIANYRLGVLGFLSTEDNVIPGNFGLMDQRMALKWVKQNIEYFGGAADRVTIAGHDAGGVSVGLHILSPLSHEYFSGAISGSGTACDPWALSENARSAAMDLARNVSCPVSSSRALMSCLQNKPIETLLELQRSLRNVTFRPTIDQGSQQPFIADRPSRLYELGLKKNVSYLAGVTRNEASIEYYTKLPEMKKKKTLDDMLIYLLGPHLKDQRNIDSIVKAAKYHYLRGYDVSLIDQKFCDLLSDFLYKSSLKRMMELHSTVTSPGYMYVFEFAGSYSLGDSFGPEYKKGAFGVSHMEDVMYLFNTSFASWITSDSSPRITSFRETMEKIWGNFVTQRNPSTTSSGTQSKINWPRFEPTNQQYIKLSDSITIESNYRQPTMDFWNILVPELQEVRVTNVTSPAPNDEKLAKAANSKLWGVIGLSLMLGTLCLGLTSVILVTRKKFSRRLSVRSSSSRERKLRKHDV